jgi:hypothetical protein
MIGGIARITVASSPATATRIVLVLPPELIRLCAAEL